jgi:hypothetical protein
MALRVPAAAVIMAVGMGIRLRPLTEGIPKSLLLMGGRLPVTRLDKDLRSGSRASCSIPFQPWGSAARPTDLLGWSD